MNTFRTVAIVALALIAVLWWAMMPPRHDPDMIPAPQASTPAIPAAPPSAPPEPQPDTRHVTTVDLRRR